MAGQCAERERLWNIKSLPSVSENSDEEKAGKTVRASGNGRGTNPRCNRTPTLTQKLSSTDENHLQRKNWLFQIEYHWWYKSYLRAGLVPSSRWPTQNKFNGGFKTFCLIMLCLGIFLVSQTFYLYIIIAKFVSMGFLYMQMYVSLHLYIFLVFFFDYFYICFVFFLFWFVCILSLFKDACLFFNEWERERGKWYTCGCGELGEQKL